MQELSGIGTMRLLADPEQSFAQRLKRRTSIHPQLSLSYDDSHGATPGTVGAIMSNQRQVFRRSIEPPRAGVIRVHEPFAAMRQFANLAIRAAKQHGKGLPGRR